MKHQQTDGAGIFNTLPRKVIPCLQEKEARSTLPFMQNEATSTFASPVKEFLIKTIVCIRNSLTGIPGIANT